MNDVRTRGAGTPTSAGVQVSLQSVYLKDCSYESPNGPRVPNNQTWEPKFQLNMNTSAEELAPDVREVLLTITLEAKQGDATLYLVEVKQAGVFTIAGASDEDMKRLIGSFCPSVLFPLCARGHFGFDRQRRLPELPAPAGQFRRAVRTGVGTPRRPALVN